MKKKKLIPIVITAIMWIMPMSAAASGSPLSNNTLSDLNTELQTSYVQIPHMQAYYDDLYMKRHQELLDAINTSNKQSILLYTQENRMTFNMAYVLKKVTTDYKVFHKDKQPYEKDLNNLNFNIERYARLIESLRRLPPRMQEIEESLVPDSLLYHNDSLEIYLSQSASALEKEIIGISKDTATDAFVLDAEGEQYRDSCIYYASEILKMYATNRAKLMGDSENYREAELRMKENYDYAQSRYKELEDYVFEEGQMYYVNLMSDFSEYWRVLHSEIRRQYGMELEDQNSIELNKEGISAAGTNMILLILVALLLLALVVFWSISYLIAWLVYRFAKVSHLQRKQLPLISIFIGTILYILLFSNLWDSLEYVQMGVNNINTFLWLLIAFAASVLLRIKPEQIRQTVLLYTPLFVIAFVIILARNTFTPDSVLVLIFPPLLLIIIARHLIGCIKLKGKVPAIDSKLGWASLVVYVITFFYAFWGYTFVSLLIFIWWYFQLALLLTVICVSDLLDRYKTKKLDKKVAAMREQITYVSGENRESLLFGATWMYDFVREVGIPMMVILSLPICARLSLNIFDFNDLFIQYYHQPFISITGDDGIEKVCISMRSIVYLSILFLMTRYLNRAIHAVWQYVRYMLFMRKNNRTHIRANEINLSLGNSIITVFIWFIYVTVVIEEWKIPTGSLGLVAGGLSAGIGLALKDIINNFIYGIQLMGGRLRVGDWIECDGVRGKVTAINYQCVQVETINGTEMSFLNESLFGKNFNNLTRNNSYEFVAIQTGVAYGTDIQKVREVLLEAMQQLCTKDQYGREMVEPEYGIRVVVGDMSDSAVDIKVKQYVLVAERINYIDRAKEVVYNALNAAGITIPFPQCDVHIIKE